MAKIKLITTIKNRKEHFLQSFPFLVSQYGSAYELVLVDYHSNDGLQDVLQREVEFREPSFSPYLKAIYCIRLLKDYKFNLKKARNLGTSHFSVKNQIYAFTDIDTFLGMNYIHSWSEKVRKNETFVATRIQDTKAALPRRIRPEVNAGNFLLYSDDFRAIGGHDESMLKWGGGDDDLFHRLKLKGLREINPYGENDALQYSIIHGDELRLKFLETPEKANKEKAFAKIYSNDVFKNDDCKFLNIEYTSTISRLETLYSVLSYSI